MKKIILFVLLFASAVVISSCSCGCGSGGDNSIPVYHRLAAQKYGINYSVIFNSDSSYVLCTNNGGVPGKLPRKALRFFVYDLKNGKIIFEDTYATAKIKWINKYKLSVKNFPEAFSKRKNQNLIKIIYDVKKGIKIKEMR